MHWQSAALEDLEHREIFRQDLRVQLLEPGRAGDTSEMAHQRPPDTLSLVGIRHGEGDLGSSGLRVDIAGATDNDGLLPILFEGGYQGDVLDEVDVYEIVDLLLREAALQRKEPPVERLGTEVTYGSNEILSVLSPKGPNFNGTSVAQQLLSEYLAAFDVVHSQEPKFWRLPRSDDGQICASITPRTDCVAASRDQARPNWPRRK